MTKNSSHVFRIIYQDRRVQSAWGEVPSNVFRKLEYFSTWSGWSVMACKSTSCYWKIHVFADPLTKLMKLWDSNLYEFVNAIDYFMLLSKNTTLFAAKIWLCQWHCFHHHLFTWHLLLQLSVMELQCGMSLKILCTRSAMFGTYCHPFHQRLGTTLLKGF